MKQQCIRSIFCQVIMYLLCFFCAEEECTHINIYKVILSAFSHVRSPTEAFVPPSQSPERNNACIVNCRTLLQQCNTNKSLLLIPVCADLIGQSCARTQRGNTRNQHFPTQSKQSFMQIMCPKLWNNNCSWKRAKHFKNREYSEYNVANTSTKTDTCEHFH